MARDPNVEERLKDLEQIIIKQADRINALEDELRATRQMLVRLVQARVPDMRAA